MVPLLFQKTLFHPLPDGALFWPAEEALLVADLHFEKAQFFAQAGQYLPPYDSQETLRTLADAIEATGAQRLFCLGDSFHHADGITHMPDETRHMLEGLAARLEDWIWITGNHDKAPPFSFGCTLPELILRGIALRHEAMANSHQPEISGHFHPKLRLRTRGQSIARRCFLTNGNKLILPAFGALTGGLDAGHPAIHAVMPGPVTALVPSGERLLRFPVTAKVAA
ncbi:MAG: ligase-associated DNA damage response endonuclease PdeM [Sphingomonadales bacterium]|nr:MAG: ligase-associated DNA damage response endonuclease PdeM [Sphingomonadales bacterium]TNF03823.1 MAG: ligase-associated DNA damage response endonuclease PdeM [Sphingomonadales bacterium]